VKKVLLLLTLFFVMSHSYAQIWVQPNAVWHYDYWVVGGMGFVKIEHIGDSVIQNKTTMKLQSTWFNFQMNQFGAWFFTGPQISDTNYLYADGDTVFYFQNNQFQKLFDFSKTIGDAYAIGNTSDGEFCNTTSTAEVSNVGIDILGYPILTLSSPPTSDLRIEYGDYNTRFGGGAFLFPQRYYNCDPQVIHDFPIFTFKCFQDDGMFYNPSGEDCEYMLTHLDLEGLNSESPRIYPNPTSSLLNIQTEQEFVELKLVDIKGKVLLKESQNLSKVIDVSFFSPGIYFIELMNVNNDIFNYRFIKN